MKDFGLVHLLIARHHEGQQLKTWAVKNLDFLEISCEATVTLEAHVLGHVCNDWLFLLIHFFWIISRLFSKKSLWTNLNSISQYEIPLGCFIANKVSKSTSPKAHMQPEHVTLQRENSFLDVIYIIINTLRVVFHVCFNLFAADVFCSPRWCQNIFYAGSFGEMIQFDYNTLPGTSKSHLKIDGSNTSLSFWVSAHFQALCLLVLGWVRFFKMAASTTTSRCDELVRFCIGQQQ